MKNILLLLFSLNLGLPAWANGQDRIVIQSESSGKLKAGTIEYTFQLRDNVSNKALTDLDLNESHTKKIHFIAYDAALKEFNHVHPLFDGTAWKVELSLPVDGNYTLWAQGELLDGTEFSTSTKTQVADGLPANPVLTLKEVRQGTDGGTIFDLANTKIKAGKMVMLNFKVSRTDGAPPLLAPYLGALAHVIATPAGGTELIHVHPMQGNEPNTGMIHATFPKEGPYRLWVQFIDHEELKTIPLSVIVFK